jgi:hypothetical protein
MKSSGPWAAGNFSCSISQGIARHISCRMLGAPRDSFILVNIPVTIVQEILPEVDPRDEHGTRNLRNTHRKVQDPDPF